MRVTGVCRNRSLPRKSVQVPGDVFADVDAWDVMEMGDVVKACYEAGGVDEHDTEVLKTLEQLLRRLGPHLQK